MTKSINLSISVKQRMLTNSDTYMGANRATSKMCSQLMLQTSKHTCCRCLTLYVVSVSLLWTISKCHMLCFFFTSKSSTFQILGMFQRIKSYDNVHVEGFMFSTFLSAISVFYRKCLLHTSRTNVSSSYIQYKRATWQISPFCVDGAFFEFARSVFPSISHFLDIVWIFHEQRNFIELPARD